ncbi:hypothetical protein GCM10011403_09950 [Pseudohongiella nitratireducens]|jgi:hypothetical protein|uniref:Uncharacterized protein n=1 Tax=Pseudohongiella nitratireducens TaxID=1768907 RepID=A0A917GS02_9GAMM|nr:hypothetical protein [Pseudohongiella nitratireducens]GGG54866.1 hypothetical protein GCM10011403_09950 [Pseudohongiella nitratireducens]
MQEHQTGVWRKLLGGLCLLGSLCCLLAALATVINLGFIFMRPDSISVANTFVGQFVVIVAALVLSRWLFRTGRQLLSSGGNMGGDAL